MRIFLSFALLGASLGGCTWVNDAKPTSAFPRDKYACAQQALRQYPQVFTNKTVGGNDYQPTETRCHDWRNGRGQTCETDPGGYLPPVVSTVDVNLLPRRDAIVACLLAGGWTRVAGFSGANW